jgi:crotonobetainyl-CoA:carnitine CoA-transferase CaiB-like acyl-CoA transferase
MLSPYKVLDLSNERGHLCGQILGDLGADVMLVEPPPGSLSRHAGPFYRDQPGLDRSLGFWAFNRNKRSITLDLEVEANRKQLRTLAASADFLIESYSPGTLARRGLGYTDLAHLNPSLIYVSITAFGQKGPKVDLPQSDLIVVAADGPLLLQGDSDRAPLRLTARFTAHSCLVGRPLGITVRDRRHRLQGLRLIARFAHQMGNFVRFGTARGPDRIQGRT